MAFMLVKSDEKNVAPKLVERDLMAADTVAIELALRTKRPLGWVHAMALARRVQELEAEVDDLRSRGTAGERRR